MPPSGYDTLRVPGNYGLGEEARKSRLLNTRTKPMLLLVAFADRSIFEISNVPAVPPSLPGLDAWKTKSVGVPVRTVYVPGLTLLNE